MWLPVLVIMLRDAHKGRPYVWATYKIDTGSHSGNENPLSLRERARETSKSFVLSLSKDAPSLNSRERARACPVLDTGVSATSV